MFRGFLTSAYKPIQSVLRQSIMPKRLAVFDFDHTILDDNSDTAIFTLVNKNDMPKELKTIQYSEGWTAFMQGVFKFFYEHGITTDDVKSVIRNLHPVQGMSELILELHRRDEYDMIIISDSNSDFIASWLEQQEMEQCFLSVFTNPAKIVDGMFQITPFHHQTSCKLSSKNLCKGQVLEDFLESRKNEGVIYEKVIYIGDGVNDFCPALRLDMNDLLFVRNHYKLLDLVNKAKSGQSLDNTGKPHNLRADLLVWDTGDEILKKLTIN